MGILVHEKTIKANMGAARAQPTSRRDDQCMRTWYTRNAVVHDRRRRIETEMDFDDGNIRKCVTSTTIKKKSVRLELQRKIQPTADPEQLHPVVPQCRLTARESKKQHSGVR